VTGAVLYFTALYVIDAELWVMEFSYCTEADARRHWLHMYLLLTFLLLWPWPWPD